MRTLILMRHAKAVRAHEAPSDEARVLNERGRREAKLAGAAMAEAGLAPKLALVSTAARTRETAALGLAGFALAVRFEEALYHASREGIWDAFAACEDSAVVIVGHNPGMGELAAMLIHQAHDGSKAARVFASRFPTAAFAAFEVGGDVLRAAGPRLLAAWAPARD